MPVPQETKDKIQTLIQDYNQSVAQSQRVHPDDPLFAFAQVSGKILELHVAAWDEEYAKKEAALLESIHVLTKISAKDTQEQVLKEFRKVYGGLREDFIGAAKYAYSELEGKKSAAIRELEKITYFASFSGYVLVVCTVLVVGVLIGRFPWFH